MSVLVLPSLCVSCRPDPDPTTREMHGGKQPYGDGMHGGAELPDTDAPDTVMSKNIVESQSVKRMRSPIPCACQMQIDVVPLPENVTPGAMIVPIGIPVAPSVNVRLDPDPAALFWKLDPTVPNAPLSVGAHDTQLPIRHATPMPQLVPSVSRVHARLSERGIIAHEPDPQRRSLQVRDCIAFSSHVPA